MNTINYEKRIEELQKTNRVLLQKLERSELDRIQLEKTNDKKEALLRKVIYELRESQRMLDDFLSTVSHELRSPLATIKMATRMLEVTLKQASVLEAKPTKVVRYLQILKQECERQNNLVNNLLDLSRLDAQAEVLKLATIDLAVWLPSIAAPFMECAHNQRQQLELYLEEPLPPLTTDISSLERILTELLHNACKYTPIDGAIAISARTQGEMLQLSITNSGVEISTEHLNRIFEKFYRVPNSDTRKQGGTGLGLALVKKLISHIGGIVWVESAKSKTCFIVELPVAPENLKNQNLLVR